MRGPQGQHWDITSDRSWGYFVDRRAEMIREEKKVVVSFVDAARSLDQNAMSFALYKQIASQLDDQSIIDIRSECKLTVGVLLLRNANPSFKAFYDKGLRHLTHEEKLDAMVFVPVTSLMSKKVFSEYLDEVIRKYSRQGLVLINPSEMENYANN